MASANAVFLIGNLTRDPELRYTQSGLAVASFGLAVNRKWTGKDGKEGEEVLFIDCACFGKRGEACANHLKKGSPVFIEGRLKLDQWTDKQSGQGRQKITVVAENVQFLGSKGAIHAATTDDPGGAEREAGDDVPF